MPFDKRNFVGVFLRRKFKKNPIPDGAPGTGVSGIGDPEHPGIGAPTGNPNRNQTFACKMFWSVRRYFDL